jgi:hypothetical protein
MDILDFNQALLAAREQAVPLHLLIGNGFSMACDDKFGYDIFWNTPRVRKLRARRSERWRRWILKRLLAR